ncbi:MAG: putative alpha/beta superfamily hydrolase [Phenylobacterium sp.]|jgi:predicted alpha/beta superfamily hydrolase
MKWITTAAFALWFCANTLAATPHSTPIDSYGSQLSIPSKVLGEDRTLQVYLPEGYETSKRTYPVLVILDADDYFLHGVTFQKTLKRFEKSPDFIVVGFNTHFRQRRALFGHQAATFSEFLSTELMPYIEQNYRISNQRILFGWEMAGGMASEVMAQTDLFSAYLMASPTHIDEERLEWVKTKVATYDKKGQSSPFLYVTQAQGESFTNDLTSALNHVSPEGFDWQADTLQDDDHHTTPYQTIYQGLRCYFADYPPLEFETMAEFNTYGGMKSLKAHYQARGTRYDLPGEVHDRTQYALLMQSIREDNYAQFDMFLGEFTFFTDELKFPGWAIGWSDFYLKHKKYLKAQNVLAKAIQQFPNAAMLYAAMGDTYVGLGQKENATKSFNKAISLALKGNKRNLEVYQQKLKAL